MTSDSASPVVVALGHRFPNLDPEREILEPLGARIIDTKGMPNAEAAEIAIQADAILVGAAFPVDAAFLRRLEHCRCIVRYGIGMDNVDVRVALERNIAVDNVPDYATEEVSTTAMAMLLALHRQLVTLDRRARTGQWTFTDLSIPRLSACTLGLIGLGRIGSEVCRKARAFGMRVRVYDPHIPVEDIQAAGAEPASLDELLSVSDFISLHTPLTEETSHMLNAERLARMKPSAYVINVARGALIDQKALAEAVRNKRIAGAGLDVFEREPLAGDDPLATLRDSILSPHAAWYSDGARHELQVRAATKVAQLLFGHEN